MIYCISDIHGEFDLFRRMLDLIKFSDSDTLISCGDIIDKGKDSVRLLKFIANMPNARCINGNHEYAFLKYYWGLMSRSPNDFDLILNRLRAYFPHDGNLLDWDLVDWLESRPYYIEEKDFICVHAGAPLDRDHRVLPLDQASNEQFVYDRTFKDPTSEVRDSKCVLFGHTPTKYILNGESKVIAYRRKGADRNSRKITDFYKIHLDTGASPDQILGCFCVDTCRVFYVKKRTE